MFPVPCQPSKLQGCMSCQPGEPYSGTPPRNLHVGCWSRAPGKRSKELFPSETMPTIRSSLKEKRACYLWVCLCIVHGSWSKWLLQREILGWPWRPREHLPGCLFSTGFLYLPSLRWGIDPQRGKIKLCRSHLPFSCV